MELRYRGTEDEIKALGAYVKLMRAAECVTARVHRHLGEEKLTVSQFGVLEALYHVGPLCQRDLAHKLLKSGGNMTMVVANLEKRKLVRRRRQSGDRRYYVVELTGQGQELIKRLFPRHAAGIADEFNVLDSNELRDLQAICRKLGLKEGC